MSHPHSHDFTEALDTDGSAYKEVGSSRSEKEGVGSTALLTRLGCCTQLFFEVVNQFLIERDHVKRKRIIIFKNYI